MSKDNFSLFWKLEKGKMIRKEVLKSFFAKKALRGVPNLNIIEDKIDLRGIRFRQEDEMGFFKFKNLRLSNIDFSYANFTLTTWQNVIFENIIFEESIFDNTTFTSCRFYNCQFIKSHFNLTHFDYCSEKERGFLENIVIDRCKINILIFYFPVIKNLIFDSCSIKGVLDFGGSSLSNSKFIGTLENIIFRGYPKKEEWKSWIDKLLGRYIRNVKDYPNPMQNIDFLEANLQGVTFTDDIDLSNCIFKNDNINTL